MTDPRLAAAPVVATFAERLPAVVEVVGVYAGGSLAVGDYRPGVSDLDLAAVVTVEPGKPERAALTRLHQDLAADHAIARKLHCFYLASEALAEPSTPHVNWAHEEVYRRPFTVVARAELLRHGIAVLGPPPAELLPPVDPAALRAGARAELTGYWAGAVRKPHLWLQDLYVDLGLLTVARVEATVTEDRLITKAEALTRLHRFGVPDDLVAEIARRRAGDAVALTRAGRVRRAVMARRIVADGIRTLGPAGGARTVA